MVVANVDALIYIPGKQTNEGQRQGSVTFTNKPIDLQCALQSANVYLSNGGLSGVGLALTSGCWPIIVPQQAEQVATVRNLVKRDWGGLWMPGMKIDVEISDAHRQKLRRLQKAGSEIRLLQLVQKITHHKLVPSTEAIH